MEGLRRPSRYLVALGAATVLALAGDALATLPSQPTYGTPQTALGLNPFDAAVGDVNGDGIPDVVAANAGDDDVSVLLGVGGGILRPRVDYPSGDETRAVALADLDRDGALDLLAANLGARNLVVLRGRGDGTFAPSAEYALGGGGEDIAVGDLNGDGAPDAVVASSEGTEAAKVFLNDGHGALTGTAIAGSASGAALGDLDDDGHLDLALVSLSGTGAHRLRGNGDGTFTSFDTIFTGGATKVAFGDVDGDGHLDLATADLGDGTTSVALNRGDGTFHSARPVRVGALPVSVAMGDLDGDRRAEIVTADIHTASANGTLTVVTYRAGHDFETRQYPLRQAWGVTLAHMNADPLLDAVVVSGDGCRPRGCFTPGRATVLLNVGAGELGGYGVYETGGARSASGCAFGFDKPRERAVAVGDLNGDGRPDLAVTNCEARSVTLLLNQGFNRFEPGGFFSAAGDVPDAIAAGDVDGDGDPDLVVVYDTSLVYLHRNDGGASFSSAPEVVGQALREPFVSLQDMNDDGSLDIVLIAGDVAVVGGSPRTDAAVLANDGAGHFIVASTLGISPDRDLHTVAVADLDGDGDKDVASANQNDGDLVILANDGSGRLLHRATFGLRTAHPTGIAAGDVDGDGDNDLAISDPVTNAVLLYLNDAAANFTLGTSLPAGDEVTGVALADLNTDGRLDLAYAQPIASTNPDENVVVRLGTAGEFGDPVAYLGGIGSRSVYAAQLNLAGGPELIVTDDEIGAVWIHFNGRAGLFIDVDLDRVPDLLEQRLGLDPRDPDTDDDHIPDGLDPDVLAGPIGGLPTQLFLKGKQDELLKKLSEIAKDLGKGKNAKALKKLLELGERFDGCQLGKQPDATDWIRDCGAQEKLRLPFMLLVSNLRGVPLPKEFLPPPQDQPPGK